MINKPEVPNEFPTGYDRLAWMDGFNRALSLVEEYERAFAEIVGVCKDYGDKERGHRVSLKFVQGIAEQHSPP